MIAVDLGKYSDRAVEQQLPWIGLFYLMSLGGGRQRRFAHEAERCAGLN